MPASPTICGRATPSDRSRFSSRILRAASRWYYRHVGWVDPLGQVPQALPASTPRDGYLTEGREELQHLGDVAVVGPARRRPRQLTGARHVARRQRAGCAQQVEPNGGTHRWRPAIRGAARCRRARRPCRRDRGRGSPLGAPWRPPARSPPPDSGARTACGPARVPAASGQARMRSPGDQVRTGRHRGRRVQLQERQLVDNRAQVMRPVSVEQLSPDGDFGELRRG
jgi:hypothetical protein